MAEWPAIHGNLRELRLVAGEGVEALLAVDAVGFFAEDDRIAVESEADLVIGIVGQRRRGGAEPGSGCAAGPDRPVGRLLKVCYSTSATAGGTSGEPSKTAR